MRAKASSALSPTTVQTLDQISENGRAEILKLVETD